MPQIQTATLTRIANWFTLKMLTDTCDILRLNRVQVPSGGYTETYPKHNTDPVPCLVTSAGVPQELLTAGQEVGFVPKIIVLPAGTDVLGSDRIKVGVLTYHVIDLFEPSTDEVVRRVLARRSSLAG